MRARHGFLGMLGVRRLRPASRFPGRTGVGRLVLPCVLAALLGVLGILQYRWVGQLSADERERIKDHLRDSAEEFAEDFNRELTRAFFLLQVGPEIGPESTPTTDIDRYERWFTATPHPELITTIYQVDIDAAGEPTLRQFFRHPARLEPAEWPTALERVRDAIAGRHAPTDPSVAHRPPFMRVPMAWPDQELIVAPRVRLALTSVTGSQTRQFTMSAAGPTGYVIGVLNRQYIREQLMPQLVARHFSGGSDGALHVAIKGAKEVVYATPGAMPKVIERADVREELWEIRFQDFNRFVTDRRVGEIERPRDGRGDEPRGARPRGAPGREGLGREIMRITMGAPPPPANVMLMYRSDDRSRAALRNAAQGVPPWHVHVLHGAGSLDAAVARARTRNLLVSFGVLLLLGSSMTLVLISSARARRLAAQQMEFVAGVSHELRTPLAVIRSAAENLADGIVDDGPQVKRYGQLIAGEGRRLTQMVEQVMTFAGLEAGHPGFDVKPIEIGPVVDDALSAVAPMARDQGAEIECDVASALPHVMADPSAVGRALQNLLGNALKYGGEPPRIRVSVRPSPRTRELHITVTDNGSGIPPRDLPHIFEPFYRGADVVARQVHGSGLGLSLVRRIMQELGGRVSVVSEPGRGSSFTLHLPVVPEAELVTHASSAQSIDGKPPITRMGADYRES
jgi:signal transduction histidine kinase